MGQFAGTGASAGKDPDPIASADTVEVAGKVTISSEISGTGDVAGADKVAGEATINRAGKAQRKRGIAVGCSDTVEVEVKVAVKDENTSERKGSCGILDVGREVAGRNSLPLKVDGADRPLNVQWKDPNHRLIAPVQNSTSRV